MKKTLYGISGQEFSINVREDTTVLDAKTELLTQLGDDKRKYNTPSIIKLVHGGGEASDDHLINNLPTKELRVLIDSERVEIFDRIETADNLDHNEFFPEYSKDKDIVLALVKKNRSFFQYADRSLKQDRDIILAVVSENPIAFEVVFQDAPDDLKKDKDFVLKIVSQNGHAIKFVSDELRDDDEIVTAAVKSRGWVLRYAPPRFKKNKDVVLDAVRQDGLILQHASKELRADRDVVLDAVRQDGFALQFASKELRADKEIVLEAIIKDKEANQFKDPRLSKEINKDFQNWCKNNPMGNFSDFLEVKLKEIRGEPSSSISQPSSSSHNQTHHIG